MNIAVHNTYTHRWHDFIHCTCWFEGMKSQIVSISKKKILKCFSEKEELNDFHLLLLDNIIQTLTFVYYTENEEFRIHLYGDKIIIIHIPQKDFEDIVTNCTADQN